MYDSSIPLLDSVGTFGSSRDEECLHNWIFPHYLKETVTDIILGCSKSLGSKQLSPNNTNYPRARRKKSVCICVTFYIYKKNLGTALPRLSELAEYIFPGLG
jgi:hypothetical protein